MAKASTSEGIQTWAAARGGAEAIRERGTGDAPEGGKRDDGHTVTIEG